MPCVASLHHWYAGRFTLFRAGMFEVSEVILSACEMRDTMSAARASIDNRGLHTSQELWGASWHHGGVGPASTQYPDGVWMMCCEAASYCSVSAASELSHGAVVMRTPATSAWPGRPARKHMPPPSSLTMLLPVIFQYWLVPEPSPHGHVYTVALAACRGQVRRCELEGQAAGWSGVTQPTAEARVCRHHKLMCGCGNTYFYV